VADRASAALAALAVALASWPSAAARVRGRVRRLRHREGAPALPGRTPRPGRLPPVLRRRLLAAAAGTAFAVVLGGTWGLLLGVGLAAAADRLLRRPGGATERSGDRLADAVPVACDLLAVCLEAGVPPGAALAAVAGAVPDPLHGVLLRVAGLYRLGAEPVRAWADAPTAVQGLARAFVRSAGSGSAVVPALRTLASDVRAASRARTDAAVRRAGVWVLAPLGVCFLPAFLCLGVVPLVLGIAHGVFG
jgi:Flp pilus assembly protein TadB